MILFLCQLIWSNQLKMILPTSGEFHIEAFPYFEHNLLALIVVMKLTELFSKFNAFFYRRMAIR